MTKETDNNLIVVDNYEGNDRITTDYNKDILTT